MPFVRYKAKLYGSKWGVVDTWDGRIVHQNLPNKADADYIVRRLHRGDV